MAQRGESGVGSLVELCGAEKIGFDASAGFSYAAEPGRLGASWVVRDSG